jgi:hypothetical protein
MRSEKALPSSSHARIICVGLRNLRMIRYCLSVQSAIRNPQSAIKTPTTYGIRPPFRPLLMVWPDAWHLIIFRAIGGQNARKCFYKNGTYINLGLLKKVKKPFKTVKKL